MSAYSSIETTPCLGCRTSPIAQVSIYINVQQRVEFQDVVAYSPLWIYTSYEVLSLHYDDQ